MTHIVNEFRIQRKYNVHHNRFRFWGIIDELEHRVLRVVTLQDKKTIHNAFPDRGYKP